MEEPEEIKRTAILMDAEWRDMIDALAGRWGIRKGRHVTHILRSCTMRVYEQEIIQRASGRAVQNETPAEYKA